MEMKRLVENIDAPMRRMNDTLKNVQDNLEGRTIACNKVSYLMDFSVEARGNSALVIARTIYPTSRANEERCPGRNRSLASFGSSL
jgi:hypothetical protein